MVLAEAIAYELGKVTADIVIITIAGPGVFSLVNKVNCIAKAHKLVNVTASVVTNNVFECLQYID